MNKLKKGDSEREKMDGGCVLPLKTINKIKGKEKEGESESVFSIPFLY